MADSMKKVGLVFKADGSVDFTKTLKEVNQELKLNYENFKLTQSQYDNNTKASDKLKDRYEYLNSAIDIQKDKVRQLNEILEEQESAENKDEAAINKTRIALTQAESSLQRYENQQKEVNEEIEKGTADWEQFANKISTSSAKITDTGKEVSKASAAVGALGIGAIKIASDFDSAMSEVQAISGATGDNLLSLRDKAEEMGSRTKYTATESANAFYYMSLAGWDTKDMLDGIEPVLNLATAANMDLASASDIVTDYLTAFGLEAKDASGFVDQMAYAMSKSNTNVDQLGEAYKNVAATATQLGYSLEDTTSALMVMANAGIKGGEAGTALSSIMTRLGNNVSGCRDLLEEYGIEVYDSQGNVKSLSSILGNLQNVWGDLNDEQKSNLSYIVAGKTAQSQLMTLLSDSTGKFEEYTNGLKECNGTAQSMSDIMNDNLKGDLTQLGSQISTLGITLAENLMPIIRDFIQSLSSMIERFSQMSPGMQKFILIIGSLLVALGPLLIMIGKIGTGVSTVIGIGTKLVPMFSKIGGSISAVSSLLNVHTLIIAAVIAAVVFLVVEIVKHWDEIVAATSAFIDGIKSFFMGFVDFIKMLFNKDWSEAFGIFGDIINGALQNVKNIFNSFKQIFSGLITFIKGVFTGDWKMAWEGVKNIFKGVFNLLVSIAKAPLNLIIGCINGLITGLNTFIKGVNKIKIPDWVPNVGGKGINLKTIGKISYLATGGELLKGTAIVGEAGPEMLINNGSSTKVVPLTKGANYNVIDYEQLFKTFLKALTSCKMQLDRDGFIEFVDDRLAEIL